MFAVSPLQRSIRGKLDFSRMADPMGCVLATTYPTEIPSQRIGLDEDGNGHMSEPLQDDEHVPVEEKSEKQGPRIDTSLRTACIAACTNAQRSQGEP